MVFICIYTYSYWGESKPTNISNGGLTLYSPPNLMKSYATPLRLDEHSICGSK